MAGTEKVEGEHGLHAFLWRETSDDALGSFIWHESFMVGTCTDRKMANKKSLAKSVQVVVTMGGSHCDFACHGR